MRNQSRRGRLLRERLVAAAAVALALASQIFIGSVPIGSARADTIPANIQETNDLAMLYPASPRTITWQLQDTPTGQVVLNLSDALTGTNRALTGPQTLLEGASMTVYPPMLEAGTYVLTWTYPTLLGQMQGTRAVHVGTPTGTVSSPGETFQGVNPLTGFAFMLTGVLFAVCFLLVANRQRVAQQQPGKSYANIGIAAAAALCCLGLSASVVVLTRGAFGSVGLLNWVGVVLGGMAAGLFLFSLLQERNKRTSRAAGLESPRGERWGAVFAGAAGGWCLGAAGQWPLFTALAGAVGGAGLVVFAGALAGTWARNFRSSPTAEHPLSQGAEAERGSPTATTSLLVLGAAGLLLIGSVFLSRLHGEGYGEWLIPLVGSLVGVGLYTMGLALATTRSAQDSHLDSEMSTNSIDRDAHGESSRAGAEDLPAGGAAARSSTRSSTRPLLMGRGVVLVALGLLTGLAAPLVLMGSSEVRALPTSASASAQECLDEGNFLEQSTCLDYVFTAKTRSSGTRAALDELREAQTQFPQLRAYCHETSHAIGRASVGLLEGSIARAFEDGYDVCDFGYYHGVIEGAAGGLSDAEFLKSAPDLCAELATSTDTLYFQCFHGIGHAAARRTNNDINRGLGMCDAIRQVKFVRDEELQGALNGCGTGVTMEWFSIAQKAGLEFVLPKVQDIKDVCLSVDEAWAQECVEYLANTLDTANAVGSLNDIVSWCETNTDQMQACLRGVSRTSAALGVDLKEVLALCERDAGASMSCMESYLIYLATTVEFDVDSVERACALLPAPYTTGAGSPCARASKSASDVLLSLDGKSESFAGRNSGVTGSAAGGNAQ